MYVGFNVNCCGEKFLGGEFIFSIFVGYAVKKFRDQGF